jgi:hypothetical protein
MKFDGVMNVDFIQKYKLNTRRIFLVDGLGAALTAFMLGGILPIFIEYIGMPEYVLFSLSSIALTFAVYSLSCFFLNVENLRLFLAIIIFCNIMYCLLTAALMVLLRESLTVFGLIYFIGEQFVVMTLIVVEFLVFANREKK